MRFEIVGNGEFEGDGESGWNAENVESRYAEANGPRFRGRYRGGRVDCFAIA